MGLKERLVFCIAIRRWHYFILWYGLRWMKWWVHWWQGTKGKWVLRSDHGVSTYDAHINVPCSVFQFLASSYWQIIPGIFDTLLIGLRLSAPGFQGPFTHHYSIPVSPKSSSVEQYSCYSCPWDPVQRMWMFHGESFAGLGLKVPFWRTHTDRRCHKLLTISIGVLINGKLRFRYSTTGTIIEEKQAQISPYWWPSQSIGGRIIVRCVHTLRNSTRSSNEAQSNKYELLSFHLSTMGT